MATMLEIATAAGVAKSTVSRALREDPTLSIGEETRDRIFQTAQQMGYHIKKKKLLSGASSIVVIHKDTHFLNQLDNAYYFSVRYGIEKVCLTLGIQCSFVPFHFLHQFPMHADGIIVMGNFEKEQIHEMIDFSHKIPMIFIGKINYAPVLMDWVTYDVKASVDMAMQYLLDTGHTTVIYIGGHDVLGTPNEYQKLFHFKHFLAEHPQLTCLDIIEGNHGTESGYQMTQAWLAQHMPLPQAIFVSNDPIAFGVLRSLAEKDISVPSQISIISINGDGPGASSTPPLTTVDIHTSDMGEEAVRCLHERMQKERTLIKKVLFAPTLISRNSVHSSL